VAVHFAAFKRNRKGKNEDLQQENLSWHDSFGAGFLWTHYRRCAGHDYQHFPLFLSGFWGENNFISLAKYYCMLWTSL